MWFDSGMRAWVLSRYSYASGLMFEFGIYESKGFCDCVSGPALSVDRFCYTGKRLIGENGEICIAAKMYFTGDLNGAVD